MRSRAKQQGQAMLLMLTILILGFTWYVSRSLLDVSRETATREARTGAALAAAKQAMLAHVARMAADGTEASPGRLPCPEIRAYATNTDYKGLSGPQNGVVCDSIGRLPWRTIGITQLVDGWGEPLWYVVPTGTWAWDTTTGFSNASNTINPATANQLPFDGVANSVVAVIIAPGPALNTTTASGSRPAGCNAVAQSRAWNTGYVPSPPDFIETNCNNDATTYGTFGVDPWSNDRSVSITVAEVMDAISGAVADRIQRTVAPVIANWDANENTAALKSWGATWGIGANKGFLPFPSTFDPANSPACGNSGAGGSPYEGLLPLGLTSALGTCDTRWTNPFTTTSSDGFGPSNGWSTGTCNQAATYLSCTFIRASAALPTTVTITATANNIGNGFHGTIRCPTSPFVSTTCDLSMYNQSTTTNISATATVNSVGMALSTSGAATITAKVTFPASISFFQTAEVRIPNVADAQFLTNTSDTNYKSIAWFQTNKWYQWTYYGVAQGWTAGRTGSCTAGTDCLSITTGTVTANDKKLVLVMAGRNLTSTAQPNTDPSKYLESKTVFPSSMYTASSMSNTFNDRLIACPYPLPSLTLCP